MTSIIKFTPLSGAKSENPPCYLLEIDEFCILLDCGWNDLFDTSLLEPLKKVASKVDVVLLSHPDLAHIGALPYAKSKLGLNAQVYGTIPLFKMGQMFMYDVYQSRFNNEDFTLFDLDDVDAAFENFKQLKYSQHLMLTGKGQGIEITPYAAGHMIGGTIWKITKETEEIVYAVDYNHKKERHLSGTVLETLTRPSLLITDAYNALNAQVNRRQRDTELFEDTLRTLRNGGNVLLPTDTAGRVLELLLCIDQYWTYNRMVYPVVFLNNVGYNVIEFAKSQLEWMSDTIMKSFETSRDNPFDFKHIRLCYNLDDVRSLPQPMVVLAGPGSLAPGFSLDLFMQWAPNPANMILFTSRSDVGTLADKLLTRNLISPVELTVGRRLPLDGEDLVAFQKTEREAKQREDEKKRAQQVEEQRKVWERDRALASEDGFTDPFHDRFDMPAPRFQALGVGFPLYPHTEHKIEWEDYGEHDEFLTKVVQDAQDGGKPAENGKDHTDKMEVEEETKIPTKIVTAKVPVNIQCMVKYIDFEGRADGRSIKNILTHVAPRKLVIVRGAPLAVDNLVQHAEQTLKHVCKTIEAPDVEQTVDLTSDTSIFKVRLKDTLVDSLQFTQVGDYELAFIDGVLATSPFAQILPMLEPASTPHGQRDHTAVYVGDVKLRDFREVLVKAGFSVQIEQGFLVCNGTVSLRKEEVDGEARIIMDGLLSDDYYKVRELLYKQYHCI